MADCCMLEDCWKLEEDCWKLEDDCCMLEDCWKLEDCCMLEDCWKLAACCCWKDCWLEVMEELDSGNIKLICRARNNIFRKLTLERLLEGLLLLDRSLHGLLRDLLLLLLLLLCHLLLLLLLDHHLLVVSRLALVQLST